jgi:hypothetical protein
MRCRSRPLLRPDIIRSTGSLAITRVFSLSHRYTQWQPHMLDNAK